MKPSALRVVVACLLGAAVTVRAQETLRTSSTLVLAPTRVVAADGELVHTLGAADFVLTDNGLPQRLTVEENLHEPLAVVVLLQTGGSAPRQFGSYRGIGTMLEYALASAPYAASLVTFDSKPEDRWPFSHDAAHLHAAFETPRAGDGGAAVLDSVEYGLDWFEDQHPRGRRILLLVSDEHFAHPAAQSRRIVKRLAETNTAIYTLSYSTEKQWLKDQFTKERHASPPWFFSPDHPSIIGTVDLLTPLTHALGAMQKDSAGAIAALSGGASMRFGDRRELEQQMTLFANDLTNRYLLSFQPTSATEGLHEIYVGVPLHPEYRVAARSGYWRNAEPVQTK